MHTQLGDRACHTSWLSLWENGTAGYKETNGWSTSLEHCLMIVKLYHVSRWWPGAYLGPAVSCSLPYSQIAEEFGSLHDDYSMPGVKPPQLDLVHVYQNIAQAWQGQIQKNKTNKQNYYLTKTLCKSPSLVNYGTVSTMEKICPSRNDFHPVIESHGIIRLYNSTPGC